MFVMSAILLYTAVALLLGVRPYIDVPPNDSEYQPAPEDESALDDTDDAQSGEAPERGRTTLRSRDPDAARRASINRVSISEETL